MNLHHIQANGLEFAYHEAGDGPLVLLVHGFPDTARTWDAYLEPIAAAGFHVVAPYLRGYHPTALPERDTTTLDLGEDVLGLMDALEAQTAVIVGHDWGASAVFAAASLAPERIEKLVTLAIPHPLSIKPSPSLVWGARHFATLRFPGAAGRFRKNDMRGVDVLVNRWAPSWNPPPAELADVKRCFAAEGSLDAALGYYRAATPSPPDFFKTKLPMPSLAFAGREDIVAVKTFYSAKRAYTGEYEVVELDCGHFPQREREAEVLAKLLAFLAS
jgi:pimeloyl-ACP methyl ester carboxylesterase